MGRFSGCLAILIAAFSLSPVAFAALPKKASILVLEAKAQPLADALSYPGRVRSRLNAVATSDSEGQVVKIEKPLGSNVKKGDVILVLQNTDPVYRYAPIKMRSLSNGFLTSMDVTLMSKVERNQKLFTVTDPKDLLVEVEIPARDLGSVNLGMKAAFKPDPLKEETVSMVIEGLSPLVDVRSGTATAQLRPNGKVEFLRQGQLGQVSLKTNERSSFVIPEAALIYRDEKPFVRVFAEGKVQKREVELGPRKGESFEVLKGLKAGDQIVTRTSRFVADGEEVEVQTAESKEPK